MAKKGNHAKNGLDRNAPKNKKQGPDSGCAVPEMQTREKTVESKTLHGENLKNDYHPGTPAVEDELQGKRNFSKSQRKEEQAAYPVDGVEQSLPAASPSVEKSGARVENGNLHRSDFGRRSKRRRGLGYLMDEHAKTMLENFNNSDNVVVRKLRSLALTIFEASEKWMERQRPMLNTLTMNMNKARDYSKLKIQQAYPVVLTWLMHLGNIILLLFAVWLDCTLRGIDSFLRMGTTSFFSVIWCSIFSVIAMVGWLKFLIALALAVFVGLFVGLTLGIIIVALSGIIFLWCYGSFWSTSLVIVLGGIAFMTSHERVALLITTVYSVYCARAYVGWLGLLLGLSVSFISNDILIYILSKNLHQQRTNSHHEQAANAQGQSSFFKDSSVPSPSSENSPGMSADRGTGAPSTSEVDSELTSEEEVVRLLNCTDHYAALGLTRYGNVDVSLLKREYRKKAMLVHPDKNMGDEKAAEAFKKLQNAYEILLDSLKRKTYDDELRREELMDYFRKFQTASPQNGRRGLFASGFTRSETDYEDPLGESRRMACKTCGNFHLWIQTRKLKSQGRWCQECNDYHQAKDGDGWVEQSSQPFLFGLFQKVDSPVAYVCADSKVYDATEWYICQGMRCPANSHKPSFHVNTSVTSKHNSGKGSGSGQKGGRGPKSNMEETMTEEEFFEWFQNAVQTGMFNDGASSTEGPSARPGNGGGNKKKKKGKKQW